MKTWMHPYVKTRELWCGICLSAMERIVKEGEFPIYELHKCHGCNKTIRLPMDWNVAPATEEENVKA